MDPRCADEVAKIMEILGPISRCNGYQTTCAQEARKKLSGENPGLFAAFGGR